MKGIVFSSLVIITIVCIALMAWPKNLTSPKEVELGAPQLVGEREFREFSGRGSWMRLQETNAGRVFKVFAEDQGGCETSLVELANDAVTFTLDNEEVNVEFRRFDVFCRQEADGGYFILSVPNAGGATQRGGVFCLFAYKVGANGFSGPIERVSQIDYCSSGGAENLALVFLVKANWVVGVLAEYTIVGAHPPSSPYYSVFFVDAAEQPTGGEPLLLRTMTTGGDVMAYVIDDNWRQGHQSGSKELERLRRKRVVEYGKSVFVLRRLWAKDDALDCQIVDTTKRDYASSVSRGQSVARASTIENLEKLTRLLDKKASGKKVVVFSRH